MVFKLHLFQFLIKYLEKCTIDLNHTFCESTFYFKFLVQYDSVLVLF